MSLSHESLVRDIPVGSTTIPMRASALIPRLYRVKFGRDIMRDMMRLQKNMHAAQDNPDVDLDAADLTIFEDVAWIMAKHADPSIPGDPDEWLDGLPGVLSIYEALPEIIALWSENLKTTAVPRKK